MKLDMGTGSLLQSYQQKKTAQTPANGEFTDRDLNEDFKKYSTSKKNAAFEQNMIFKTSASPQGLDMPENLLLTQNSQVKYPPSRLEIDPK